MVEICSLINLQALFDIDRLDKAGGIHNFC